MADAEHLNPFVLPVDIRPAERHGAVDLYPLGRALREWPVYRGYGSAVADNGAVGVTVDHRLAAHAAGLAPLRGGNLPPGRSGYPTQYPADRIP